MKECVYVYKDKKGELHFAMTLLFFLEICFSIIALPLIAFGMWVWHFFADNVMLITIEDYHKYQMEYYKRKDKTK